MDRERMRQRGEEREEGSRKERLGEERDKRVKEGG